MQFGGGKPAATGGGEGGSGSLPGQSEVPSDLYDYLAKMDRDEEEQEESVSYCSAEVLPCFRPL